MGDLRGARTVATVTVFYVAVITGLNACLDHPVPASCGDTGVATGIGIVLIAVIARFCSIHHPVPAYFHLLAIRAAAVAACGVRIVTRLDVLLLDTVPATSRFARGQAGIRIGFVAIIAELYPLFYSVPTTGKLAAIGTGVRVVCITVIAKFAGVDNAISALLYLFTVSGATISACLIAVVADLAGADVRIFIAAAPQKFNGADVARAISRAARLIGSGT